MDAASALLILLSLTLSAFFSGIEIAFISANRLRLALDSQKGGMVSKIIQSYQQKPSKFISATLVGNNIALVIYGIQTGIVFESVMVGNIDSHILRLIISTVVSTMIVLITAEFLPKALFRINPIGMLKAFIIPFHFFQILFWPISIIIRIISQLFIQLITGEKSSKELPVFTKMDLNAIIGDTTEVEIDDDKSLDTEIFKNALDFNSLKVRDCMRPRTEIVALDEDEGVEGLYKVFIDSNHSKIPIYRDSIDNIVGYVHQGAMFSRPDSISKVLIPIVITNESRLVSEVLKELTRQNKSMAVVVDEFGGTAGIVTIEDIMEEILGEIDDEYDREELKETLVKPGHYILSGRHEIEHLNKELELGIPEGDYETLGGFIISQTDSIPNVGDVMVIENFEFKIISVENARIDEVELKMLSE